MIPAAGTTEFRPLVFKEYFEGEGLGGCEKIDWSKASRNYGEGKKKLSQLPRPL
jgi:hypothetical protein